MSEIRYSYFAKSTASGVLARILDTLMHSRMHSDTLAHAGVGGVVRAIC